MLKRIILFVIASVAALSSSAADDAPRRWAVMAGMNVSCPVVASHVTPNGISDKAASFGSAEPNVMLEYWLPNPHFSIVGGYNRETLEWYGSDVSATMHNIALGARYYPLSTRCALQPYAALMAYANVGKADENSTMSFLSSNGPSYERNYTLHSPRLSVAPAIGFDCYILSSLAVEFQYAFPLAINGKANITTTYGTETATYPMHSDMHRHNFQIGLKATFPFRLTSKDVNSLFDLIYMALGIYDPNDEQHTETKEERHKQSLNKVLNSY